MSEVLTKSKGRPVNPNSKAQLKKAEKEALLASGVVIKRGRKVNPESKNQVKKAEQAARKEANGGKTMLGRPSTKAPKVKVPTKSKPVAKKIVKTINKGNTGKRLKK